MAPFLEPQTLINGLKDKVESFYAQSDRLFLGTATGTLSIYDLDRDDDGAFECSLAASKSLGKKPLEQLGYIKDINSVIALSDSVVTLYPLPDLVPPTPLPQSRKAFSFAVNSTVERVSDDGKVQSFADEPAAQSTGIPTVITYLVVGSQRKLVVYSWRDGESQEVKEAPLPHSARVIVFIRPTVLCLAYSATEHVLFYLETMSIGEIIMPVNIPASTSAGGYGMNALSGLGGYMSLGLAAKAKPMAVTVGEDVLIPRDNTGLFFGPEGKAIDKALYWPSPPEEIAYAKPYVVSVQSSGTTSSTMLQAAVSPALTTNGLVQAPVIHIQSSLTMQAVQNVLLPIKSTTAYTLRLLSSSPNARGPMFVLSSPVDRNAAASQGSSIWVMSMRTWSDQMDELVENEKYSDALSLLDSIDDGTLPDKATRKKKLRGLLAVSQFKNNEFDTALDTFIELDINPAKVVSLYPESVSGRLQVPADRWIQLFGGPELKQKKPDEEGKKTAHSRRCSVARTPSPAGSVRSVGPFRKSTLESFLPASVSGSFNKEDDRSSIRGRTVSKAKTKSIDTFPRSVESLLRYLTDRRPLIKKELERLNVTPAQAHQFPFLSETSVEDLLALPSSPLPSLTPQQLIRFAQIVDTALFKAYLIVRPGLLGPLCSLENWCEVQEVEETLMEKEKFSELVALYRGRKMHAKALSLLRKLSEKEEDIEDKIRPTKAYAQNLSEGNLDQVFDAARWIHQYDPDAVFDIFTAEIQELPRSKVADFLEDELDPSLCAKYLEYLIHDRDEMSTLFHDRLAELYLDMANDAKTKAREDEYKDAYQKFLGFIEKSDIYRVDRLFGLLPQEDMFEARAVLLGRLGKHVNALEIYVYRLGDYIKAEEYCKSIYAPDSPTQSIFLSLLKIYLEPSSASFDDSLQPALHKAALDLIARQALHLDTIETLRLLPSTVPAQDVKGFLGDAARARVFDVKVIREVRKGWKEQVSRRLMNLQGQRVRITDSRMCPQCHKRLGTSVIAVHVPHGEVTHYQCREAFAAAKNRVETPRLASIDMSSRY